MDPQILKVVGQVAGIGGLALGVFLLLFREIIRKNIFPRLPPTQAYALLRLITVAVWSVTIVGIGAWIYVAKAQTGPNIANSVVVPGTVSNSTINNGGSAATGSASANQASGAN